MTMPWHHSLGFANVSVSDTVNFFNVYDVSVSGAPVSSNTPPGVLVVVQPLYRLANDAALVFCWAPFVRVLFRYDTQPPVGVVP